MDDSVLALKNTIEDLLSDHTASKKLSDTRYVLKQGSTFVILDLIHSDSKTMLRLTANVAKVPSLAPELAVRLLTMNHETRFGAFSYHPKINMILYSHALLATPDFSKATLTASLHDVALIADNFDDKIVQEFGGSTMRDLLFSELPS